MKPLLRLLVISTLALVRMDAAERPNFILCMADDQGWGDMAYNGHPHVKTPTFDEMARHGLRLDRFYAAAPVCSPTRASVMTGRTPNRMGCFKWGNTLRPQEITVAEVLQDAGYATGHFGKWHLGSVRPDSPVNPGNSGFREWLSAPNYFDLDPWMSHNGQAVKTSGEGSEVIVDAAVKFIRAAHEAKQPFLAVVWFGSPHAPHVSTREDLARYADQPPAQQRFLAEITAMDRAMGKLRHQLRELGAADNTVLWYCSDNGAIKEGSSGGLREGKNTVWEGGLRVPGLIEWPARIKASRAVDVPCGTVDIFPTLLELAGAPPAKLLPLDGISLAPLLDGRMRARPQPMGFWHYTGGGVGVKSEELLAAQAKEQAEGNVRPWSEVQPIPETQLRRDYPTNSFPGHAAWLDGDWKLHRIQAKRDAPKWELYHLGKDRTEAHDLAAAEPGRLTQMQGQLDAWLKSVVNSLNHADYP